MKRKDSIRSVATGAGWRRFEVLAAVLLAGGLAGCSPTAYLVPAPGAAAVPHRENAEVGEVANVRVVANGNAWTGYPADLGSAYTPVKVDIHNGSNQPIEVRYRSFKLTAAGVTSRALPLYKVSGDVTGGYGYGVVPVVPSFAYQGFFIAPGYGPFYDWDFHEWDGPFSLDSGYYSTYYPMWGASLPTQGMRAEAIPEGVLAPNGRLSGFLYFQKIGKHAGTVTLTFDLVNAKTGKSIGKVDLPFVAK